ncbi:MAG: hypothetical protein U5R06_15485 [candidate division KSB1 bacterium]|nr:hypothetical protein [candidate division KSB1 bacterium]
MAGAISFFKKNVKDKSQYKAKVMSTLAAVFIWFLVVIGGTYEHITTIPVKSSLGSDEYIITSELPERVRVRIQGQGRDLLTFLLFKDAWLQLNLTWKPGTQVIKPNTSDIILARSAKRLNIRQLLQPDSILISIEPKVTRNFAIKNQAIIDPVRGYTIVGTPEISPARIKAVGPESMLSRMDSIRTRAVTFKDVKYPIETEIELETPDQDHIELLQNRVTLNADIQKLMEKRLYNIPVTVKNIPLKHALWSCRLIYH